jgi:aryl-alcohol dehydrogenase-like predicted oxidoreductase
LYARFLFSVLKSLERSGITKLGSLENGQPNFVSRMESARMEYGRLGKSGLKISKISLGCWNFGSPNPAYGIPGRVTPEDSIRLIHQAYDLGINLIDNANRYTGGEAEEIQGRAMKGRRSDFVVATKLMKRVGDRPNDEGLSRVHIMQEVDNILRRLDTDYVDLLQAHDVDWDTPLEETLRAFDDLIRQGKVRYIGCSNFPAWLLTKSLWISDVRNLASFSSAQPKYNLISREVEKEIQPLCVDQGIGMIIYSPLEGGILTGKYDQGIPADSRVGDNNPLTRERGDKMKSQVERLQRGLAALREVAQQLGKTPSQVSLNWLIYRPAVSSAIIGATRPEQIVENAGATGWKLPEELAQKLEQAFIL